MPGALWLVAEMVRAVLAVAERARTGLGGWFPAGWVAEEEGSISRNWLCEALPISGCGSGLTGMSGLGAASRQEATGEHEAFVTLMGSSQEALEDGETFWPGFRV